MRGSVNKFLSRIQKMRTMYFIKKSSLFVAVLLLVASCHHKLPDLTGTWSGEATAISSNEGVVSGEKKITIEQDGSTFRGTVVTRAGVKDILGSIASDNEHFVYVHVGDMGHAEGRILGKNRIETCYVHPGKNAVAGCSVSSREQ